MEQQATATNLRFIDKITNKILLESVGTISTQSKECKLKYVFNPFSAMRCVTRKRFIKLLMSIGIQRNNAVKLAKQSLEAYGRFPIHLIRLEAIKVVLGHT